jgi:hypothetical protein
MTMTRAAVSRRAASSRGPSGRGGQGFGEGVLQRPGRLPLHRPQHGRGGPGHRPAPGSWPSPSRTQRPRPGTAPRPSGRIPRRRGTPDQSSCRRGKRKGPAGRGKPGCRHRPRHHGRPRRPPPPSKEGPAGQSRVSQLPGSRPAAPIIRSRPAASRAPAAPLRARLTRPPARRTPAAIRAREHSQAPPHQASAAPLTHARDTTCGTGPIQVSGRRRPGIAPRSAPALVGRINTCREPKGEPTQTGTERRRAISNHDCCS